jgi:biotin transport system substrate-specific component
MDLLRPSYLLAALIGAVLIALCAQVTITIPVPSRPIPVTLQSLVVLVVAFRLRRPAGWMAVFLYVLLGWGLPVLLKALPE